MTEISSKITQDIIVSFPTPRFEPEPISFIKRNQNSYTLKLKAPHIGVSKWICNHVVPKPCCGCSDKKRGPTPRASRAARLSFHTTVSCPVRGSMMGDSKSSPPGGTAKHSDGTHRHSRKQRCRLDAGKKEFSLNSNFMKPLMSR